LLTGSLDGHVKVHELDDFTVTHAAKYPGPVLSVALSPDANVLAVGCANKLLSIRRRKVPREAAYGLGGVGGRVGVGGGKKRGPRRLDAGSWQYFVRGTNEKAAEGQMVIARRKRIRLKPYDKALRRFRVGEALDAALATGRPEVIAAVVEEIGARGGTRAALSNRDEARLGPVLRFIARQIANPRHTRQLVGVAGKVLDVYGGEVGVSPAVDGALRLIRERVAGTLKLQDALANLSGIAAPLLAAGHHAAYG
jgi:U3 small nucleolar RNA-associated protein 15